MYHFTHIAVIAVTVVAVQSNAIAQLQNSYLTNDSGTIFYLDEDTLVATEVAQLQGAGTINDILYMGNGQLIANLTFGVASYDFNTNIQATLFSAQDVQSEPSGIPLVSGLALQSDGNVYFTSMLHGPSGLHFAGATYNPGTQDIDLIEGSSINYLYFDHHEISPNRMLGARGNQHGVDIFDPSTGVLESTYSLGIDVRSFVESNGDLYILSDGGNLYTFDYTNGSTEFYGNITGYTGSLFGITIPAPSTLAALGFGVFTGTRRRRIC